MKFLIIFILGFIVFNHHVYAQKTCVVRVNYRCDSPQNNSCLDKKYCQKIVNFCYAYTKEIGKKFDSEDEIRKLYKAKPEQFEKGFELSRFINQWKTCKSGTWSRDYAKNDPKKDDNANKETGNGGAGNGTGAGAANKEIKMCTVAGDGLGGGDGMTPDPLDEPFCLNSEYGLENDNGEIESIRKGQLNGLSVANNDGPDELKRNYPARLREHMKQRMRAQGIDFEFVKRCTGQEIPDNLFRLRFQDQNNPNEFPTPEMLSNPNASLKKKLSEQCLKVEFNPKLNEWIRMINMGSKNFRYKDKSGREYKCENISDENYCNGSVACLNNLNTASAIYSGGSFGTAQPRTSTYIPKSDITNGICPALREASKAGLSDAQRKEIFTKAADQYKENCASREFVYGLVETGANIAGTVVIVGGAVVLTTATGGGTVAIIMTTALTSGAVTTFTKNNSCLATSGLASMTPEQAAKTRSDCLSVAAADGAFDSLFSAATAGLTPGISQALGPAKKTVVKQFFTEGADIGLDLAEDMMRSPTFKNKLVNYGLNTSENVLQFTAEYAGSYTTCKIKQTAVDSNTPCEPQDLLRDAVLGKVVGNQITKAMNAGELKAQKAGRKLSDAEKKAITEKAVADAKKSSQYQQAVKDFDSYKSEKNASKSSSSKSIADNSKSTSESSVLNKPTNRNISESTPVVVKPTPGRRTNRTNGVNDLISDGDGSSTSSRRTTSDSQISRTIEERQLSNTELKKLVNDDPEIAKVLSRQDDIGSFSDGDIMKRWIEKIREGNDAAAKKYLKDNGCL